MQPLIASPRDGLTEIQVRNLITAFDVGYTCGIDRVTATGDVLGAVDAKACSVTWDGSAKVPTTIQATLNVAPAAKDRLRPWIILASGSISAKWFGGVYLPETPEAQYGTSPLAFQVTGYDYLSSLDKPIPKTRVAGDGDVIFTLIDSLLSDVGFAPPVLRDSTRANATMSAPQIWPADGTITWLDVLNELLSAMSYRAAWMDWQGRLRLDPFVAAVDRAPEWEFAVGDLLTGIVKDTLTVKQDVYGQANQWAFVSKGISSTPNEGTTLYTAENTSRGPSSQRSLGKVNIAPPQTLAAASYEDLVAQGDAIVDRQIRATETIELDGRKFPPLWSSDVARLAFGPLGDPRRMTCTHWVTQYDGLAGTKSSWEVIR